jgi:hypothetical protein
LGPAMQDVLNTLAGDRGKLERRASQRLNGGVVEFNPS